MHLFLIFLVGGKGISDFHVPTGQFYIHCSPGNGHCHFLADEMLKIETYS